MSYVKMNSNHRPFEGIMKEFLNEFPSAVSKAVREDVIHYPPVNITDRKENYLVELSAPGYSKSDFNIKLDNNILTVSTGEKEEEIIENEKLIRKEFGFKAFKRSFTLNEKIDTDNIGARYENGILMLTLAKKEQSVAGGIDINID